MTGYVTGAPRTLLRLEGLIVFAASIAAYDRFVVTDNTQWIAFVALFLAPDLTMLGYLAGRKAGAAVYNLGHWYGGPFILLALGIFAGNSTMLGLGLIWAGHIGFDRALGFGLKHKAGFRFTHLKSKQPKPAARLAFQEI